MYRAYDPVTRRVHVTCDIIFEKEAQWDWGKEDDDGKPDNYTDMFTVEYAMGEQQPLATENAGEEPGAASPGFPIFGGDSEQGEDEEAEPAQGILVDNLDANHDEDGPLQTWALDDVLGPATSRGFAPRNLIATTTGELHVVSSDEPISFVDAESHPSWRKAMIEEMESIEENKTWMLVDLPPGRRAIGLKWVFKVKRDKHGAVAKHKACLVVKGYAQKQGINYDEVFASVARLDTVRLLIALTAHEGWEVHHMDVKSAFLNGDLEEEVYVQQPAGFVVANKEHKVLKLMKALYGLHQAPRAWNAKLDSTLLSLGFRRSPSELHQAHRRRASSSSACTSTIW